MWCCVRNSWEEWPKSREVRGVEDRKRRKRQHFERGEYGEARRPEESTDMIEKIVRKEGTGRVAKNHP
jgi:hypothetical protein